MNTTKNIHQETKYIVFDLKDIEFVDSAAFAMLVELNNEINSTGRTFHIANTSIQVNELNQLVKLENVLKGISFDIIPEMAA